MVTSLALEDVLHKGTYTPSNFMTPFTRRIAKVADLAFAWYLSYHVQSAYSFLVNNYKSSDDRIILIGFSRGAYACRALAGMQARPYSSINLLMRPVGSTKLV